MSQLKQLLYSDLARQYELEGRPDGGPISCGFLAGCCITAFCPMSCTVRAGRRCSPAYRLVPNLLTYFNLVLFGLEITPRCEVGPGLFFAHTSGSVIGASRIGSNVTIFGGSEPGRERA